MLKLTGSLALLLLFASGNAIGQSADSTTNSGTGPQDRLVRLEQDLTSSDAGWDSGRAATSARERLKIILATPEFAGKMHESSAWERWKQQLAMWMIGQLERLFESIARHPTTSQAIFWAGALGSLAFIAFQLFRLWRKGDVAALPSAGSQVSSAQSATEWIAAARRAAERGDLNKGIQCSYWAAIVCLQSAGTLPSDGAHTPREYLRAYPRDASPLPSATDDLRSLTFSLERFWYRRVPASPDDFAACLQWAERLGCRLD